MRGIAFHRLDEIGDEIVPLPQLHATWFRCGSASIRPMMAQIMGMTMTARMITVEVDLQAPLFSGATDFITAIDDIAGK